MTGPDPRRWKALAVLGIAYLMVVLDVSIVNVALPSIQKDLHFSPENLQWVISAYGLTFGGLLLLGGRSGDILGRRRLFMVGLGLLRALLAALRARDLVRDADRVSRASGLGGRDPLTVGVLDRHRDVRGGQGAQHRARHPRRHRRLGRGDRRAARRRPHRVCGLGVDLLRQRADRRRGALPGAPLRPGEPLGGDRALVRRGRRLRRHRRA